MSGMTVQLVPGEVDKQSGNVSTCLHTHHSKP